MYFHVRFQSALKIHKRPFFPQKASIVLGNQPSFDGRTLVLLDFSFQRYELGRVVHLRGRNTSKITE